MVERVMMDILRAAWLVPQGRDAVSGINLPHGRAREGADGWCRAWTQVGTGLIQHAAAVARVSRTGMRLTAATRPC